MEGAQRDLVPLDQDHQRPDGVDQHQQDGDESGNAVDVEGHAADELEHQASAEGVEDEAEDEEDEVPSPQSPGQPLAPHPDGVAEQSGGDERAGERIHWDLPA